VLACAGGKDNKSVADGTVISELHRRQEYLKFLKRIDKTSPRNQAGRWFGYLTDQKIRPGVHKSLQALEADIRDWIENWNENPRPFSWTKTAEEILKSLTEYMTRISGAPHLITLRGKVWYS
jgi:hypothetical protein